VKARKVAGTSGLSAQLASYGTVLGKVEDERDFRRSRA
jgi:hypothetical protein